MTTVHATNSFNVEASINDAYKTALLAITLPSFLPSVSVVFNWPEIEANLPCFSIVHFTGSSSDRYQGRVDTNTTSVMYNTGILEISAWVSRDQKVNGQDVWAAQIAFMKSMIEAVHTRTSVIRLSDYTSNPASPSTVNYKINISDLNEVQVAEDVNPSIRRKRFLINYNWHHRANN